MDAKKYKLSADATVSDIDLAAEEFTLTDGTRLTDERAEEIAASAERRRANLLPGRKSLSGGAKHSPVLQVRIPEELRDELQHVATERGVSLSKLARDILEESVHDRRAS